MPCLVPAKIKDDLQEYAKSDQLAQIARKEKEKQGTGTGMIQETQTSA